MPKTKQHQKPCKDCPWRRNAIRGWLGAEYGHAHSPDYFLAIAGGEVIYDCHLRPQHQCAGLAIFRANIIKSPRTTDILTLPGDKQQVFATREEFTEHHTIKKAPTK